MLIEILDGVAMESTINFNSKGEANTNVLEAIKSIPKKRDCKGFCVS